MEGNRDVASEKGIISRAFEHIFEAISVTTGVKYLALVSYLEIYNEQIRYELLKSSIFVELIMLCDHYAKIIVIMCDYLKCNTLLLCKMFVRLPFQNVI